MRKLPMMDDDGIRTASRSTARPAGSLCWTRPIVAILIAAGWPAVAMDGQTLNPAVQDADREANQSTYTLRITTDAITELSLSAEHARVSEITAELSKRLGVRVFLGPAMAEETITVAFDRLALEPALSTLAPRVIIDYEIRQHAQPVAKGIYLLGDIDPSPALNAVVRGQSQGLLIAGNTEETAKSAADEPLHVTGDRNRLTIVSKQQPVELIVSAIGDVLGVPAEVTFNADAAEMVDVDVRDMRPEDVIPSLSPNIRLYVRADVTRSERTLLRLVVVPHATR
jgi:hypothetical protein